MLGKLVFLVLFLSSTLAISQSQEQGLCGYVYDWGTEDVGQQYSTSYISASWAGFEPTDDLDFDNNNKVTIEYEWAIISDQIATDAMRAAGSQEDPSQRCRSEAGIPGTPDVVDWKSVDSTYANSDQLTLSPGSTYYVLLKVTTITTDQKTGESAESVLYTNGAAITISTDTRYTRNVKGKGGGKRNRNRFPNVIVNPSNLESSSPLIFVNQSELSSFISIRSSGLLAWQIALIVLSCVFALILLLLLIFVIVGRGKGEDKYETNVHRNENVEKI